LSYFEAPFNKERGSGRVYLGEWSASNSVAVSTSEEELNDTTMLDAFRPIEGTNFTTAVYYATTIDNPAFGVKAGQQVQILHFAN
jgi:hypothetical protein